MITALVIIGIRKLIRRWNEKVQAPVKKPVGRLANLPVR